MGCGPEQRLEDSLLAGCHLLSWARRSAETLYVRLRAMRCISGLVVEYIVAIDVTRIRFPADALHSRYMSLVLSYCRNVFFEKL